MRQRRLGQILRECREMAGKSAAGAGLVLDCSQAKISRIETGTNVVNKQDLRGLLEFYGALDRLPVLEQLRQEGGKRGWWLSQDLPDWLKAYISAESEAIALDCFSLELVNGLFQTERYAHETYKRHGVGCGDIEHGVVARVRRQGRLGRPDFEISAVFSEGVLCRTRSMGEVGSGQIKRLLEVSEIPHVQLRILPWGAGGHRSMASGFTLLHFPSDVADSIAYQEFSTGNRLTDDRGVVDDEVAIYASLREQALSTQASSAIIASYIEDRREED